MTKDVLAGTVTFAGKEYCRSRVWEAFENLDPGDMTIDPVVVDNTADEGSYFRFLIDEVREKWGDLFTVLHVPLDSRMPSRAKIAVSQNVLRSLTLDGKKDSLFIFESDVVLKDRGTLVDLDGLRCDVAAGVLKYESTDDVMLWKALDGGARLRGSKSFSVDCYTGGKIGSVNVFARLPGRDGWEIARKPWTLSGLPGEPFSIEGCHLGCTLIRRTVLEQVHFDYHVDSSDATDIWFSLEARASGFSFMAHPWVRPVHLPSSWKELTR